MKTVGFILIATFLSTISCSKHINIPEHKEIFPADSFFLVNAIATKLENELLTEIKNLATAHYIGHLFNDTFLDVFIYLDEPQKVHDYLQLQINKEGLVRRFGYEINQDPKWSRASIFLK